MSEPVSREEFRMLQARVEANMRRIESIDATGTRGVAVLAVQITELAKDLSAHEVKHDREETRRAAGRKWLFMAFVAVVAAVDGPIVTVMLARGGR